MKLFIFAKKIIKQHIKIINYIQKISFFVKNNYFLKNAIFLLKLNIYLDNIFKNWELIEFFAVSLNPTLKINLQSKINSFYFLL